MIPDSASEISEEPDGRLPFPGALHLLAIRVYYEDTDFSGSVYHASYLRFLERGRTEFLRSLGVEHSILFANGGAGSLHFVVRAMSLEFLKPARMDDSLTVETRLTGTGGASIVMNQGIRRGRDYLLRSRIKIGVVSGGKARRIPAEVLEKLKLAAPPPPQAKF